MTKISIDYISPQSCTSLSELFQKRITRSPQRVAYQYFAKTEQLWKRVTWHEIFELFCQWRAALIREDLTQGDRVAIMLPNSIFWVVFEQAALSLGFIVVPLYSNDRPENIAYILRNTESKILICPGNAYFNQLTPTLKDVPSLQRIITIDDCRIHEADPVLICVDDWLPDKNESIMKELTPCHNRNRHHSIYFRHHWSTQGSNAQPLQHPL